MAAPVDREALLTQAQHIWSMLDDMSANDPTGYQKFIDKQLEEGRAAMKNKTPPEPHMCVQTIIFGPRDTTVPLYINILEYQRVPFPKSDDDPIPVMGGPLYEERGEEGSYKCVSVAFNPKVLEEFGINSSLHEEHRLLINLALDYCEDRAKIKLSRSFAVLPKDKSYKGSLDKVKKMLLKDNAEDKFEAEIDELTKSFGPLAGNDKDSLLSQLSNIAVGEVPDTKSKQTSSEFNLLPEKKKTGLIEELDSSEKKVPEPHYTISTKEVDGLTCMCLKVDLPEVKTVAECELDIMETCIQLEVPGKYELSVTLPFTVNDEEIKAKFSKKSSQLTVTAPILTQTHHKHEI